MGSDYAMNPPQPIYERYTAYFVGGDSEERFNARVLELIQQRKEFNLVPIKDGYVLRVHTGRWR